MVGVTPAVLPVRRVKVEANEFGDIEIFFNEFSMAHQLLSGRYAIWTISILVSAAMVQAFTCGVGIMLVSVCKYSIRSWSRDHLRMYLASTGSRPYMALKIWSCTICQLLSSAGGRGVVFMPKTVMKSGPFGGWGG